MRISRDEWAIEMAKLTATRSTCLRRHVGCVLLNARGHVLATGYNGVAAGQKHCNDATVERMVCTKKSTSPEDAADNLKLYNPELFFARPTSEIGVHPHNSNVITIKTMFHACSGAKSPSGTNLDGCQAIHAEQNALLQCRDVYDIDTCYVTTSPCMTCTKLLLNTSCRQIVFLEEYPHTEARDLWVSAGRLWISTDGKLETSK